MNQSLYDHVQELHREIYEMQKKGHVRPAAFVMQKYNFYNPAGDVLMELLEHEEYEHAEGLIHALLAVPLKQRLLLEIASGEYSEMLYLFRLLYLIDETRRHAYVQESNVYTRLLLEYYHQAPLFSRFIERLEQRYEDKDNEWIALDRQQQLLRYALRVQDKLRAYFERNYDQCIRHTSCFVNGVFDKELGLYEIFDLCYTDTIRKVLPSSQVGVALNNLSSYAFKEAPKYYETTLLKLDLQTLYGVIDEDELLDLCEKSEVYDAHLKVSYEAYRVGDVSRAMKVLHTVVYNTAIARHKESFEHQERRKYVLEYALHLLSQLGQKERDKYMPTFMHLLDDSMKLSIQKIENEGDVVCAGCVPHINQMSHYMLYSHKKEL
jgi:hypothetical protein